MRKFITCLLIALFTMGMASKPVAIEGEKPSETTVEVSVQPATDPASTSAAIAMDPSLGREVEAALSSSIDWLIAKQHKDGSWSDRSYPALTALPLWAISGSNHPERDKAVKKAVEYLKGNVREDGGIYKELKGRKGGGLGNYNTAISIVALYATGDPELNEIILNARKFLANAQHEGDDMYRGGFGYDWATDRAYADLMNTLWATEAMILTQDLENERPEGQDKVDFDREAARKFLERLQNKAEEGGFPYRPDESKAGEYTNATGAVVLRSYGSMTYAGLLSMIYTDVDRKDPRVKSAFDWARTHWTLEENPGMGPQGLYWFYHIITKALSAYGEDEFKTQSGANIEWRRVMINKIVSVKKTDNDGKVYWTNENARFMESDKILVTAYTVLALQIASGM